MDSAIPISFACVCSFFFLSIPLSGQISKGNNSVIPELKFLSAGNMKMFQWWKKFAHKKKFENAEKIVAKHDKNGTSLKTNVLVQFTNKIGSNSLGFRTFASTQYKSGISKWDAITFSYLLHRLTISFWSAIMYYQKEHKHHIKWNGFDRERERKRVY